MLLIGSLHRHPLWWFMCTLLCKEYVWSDQPNSGDTIVRSEAKGLHYAASGNFRFKPGFSVQ